MTQKLTVKALQDTHFTSVEKFFNTWASKKTNQNFLNELPNTNAGIAKGVLKCLAEGKNPLLANGSKIRDQNKKWSEADKIIRRWKDTYEFDVVQFILNYEQEHEHKSFHQVNDPILTLNAYVSIIGTYIVTEYLDDRTRRI